jgi:SAM-dependent methyltransferase
VDPVKLYGPDYFQGGEYDDYQGHRPIHEKNFARKWALICDLQPGPCRVFEVGSAYGYFLHHALEHGAERGFGVDVSPEIVAQACRDFGPHFAVAPAVPDFTYNCLVAWDVWEHLERPLDVFREHVAKLAPGGVVALTTVDASSLNARARGRRWRQLHPPTHLHYPTREGLRLGLQSLGLIVQSQTSFKQERALESYAQALRLGGILPAFVRHLSFGLNLGDIQLVLCRKPIP